MKSEAEKEKEKERGAAGQTYGKKSFHTKRKVK